GTILIWRESQFPAAAEPISRARLHELEPDAGLPGRGLPDLGEPLSAAYLSERSVDPRALVAAAFKAARHRGVDISSGSEAKTVRTSGDRGLGVETDKASYAAGVVVNCA